MTMVSDRFDINHGNCCAVKKSTMSDEETNSGGLWCPSRLEIDVILQKLELSPIHSDDESNGSFLVCEHQSIEKNNSESGESSPFATDTIDELDHEELFRTLLESKRELIINDMKNNWLHENLVNHLKKKQMIHVCCTDEVDDDKTLNEYMKKLCHLDKMKRKVMANNERWDDELSKFRSEICAKEEEEKIAIKKMSSTGKTIGTFVWNHGKLFSAKCVEESVSKQLEKIKQISQYRFRHTKLGSHLNSIQDSLRCLTAINTNLIKNDYERLEAENFYYQVEFQNKKTKCEQLIARNITQKGKINIVRKKILKLNTEISLCKKIVHVLKMKSNELLRTKRCWRNELVARKKSVYTLEEIFRHGRRDKIDSTLAEIRSAHKEWIGKITDALRSVKHRGQTINALKENE